LSAPASSTSKVEYAHRAQSLINVNTVTNESKSAIISSWSFTVNIEPNR
jgi:hypothetical protein